MAKYKLLLPKMGESVAEATIIKWNKNIGDKVEMDEAILDIATDKVDSEVPSPVKGTLTLKLCNVDEVVQVGSVIAIIDTGDDGANEETTPEQNEAAAPAPVAATADPVQIPTVIPSIEEDEMHEEELLSEAPVQAQHIPGIDQLPAAEPEKPAAPAQPPVQNDSSRFYSPLVKSIAQQEKVSQHELDSIPGTGIDGRLTKDDLIKYIQDRVRGTLPPVKPVVTQEEIPSTPRPSDSLTQPAFVTGAIPDAKPVAAQPVAEAPKPVAEAPKPAAPTEPAPAPSAPKPPAAEAAKPAQPVPPQTQQPKAAPTGGGDEIIEMDRMRRLIAEHMVKSVHTSPHVTSFVEVDVTNIVLWREKNKTAFEKREGTKITYTPIFIEAVARAIRDMPMINVSVSGTQIIKKKDINIGMATALPSGNLIVPVIRKADELNVVGLTKAVNDLANRARTGKLQPDDVKDGTFTVTNVGTFGNVMGTPIINQPQVAILALGAIKKKPAVIETESGDVIAVRHMMFLSLSYDHRVVDGALGGSFIRRVADYLEAWDINREV
ncbi:diapophytoene dehydrogenase [Mucilaginibacter sp. PPCGB 2223]|uniref:dihydrolipoamide acetyltransferase family protein n=1 Tax=Mucilaginibacter sp. PPCGB 2223 TaxID=1886027 RepID=UPI000825C4BE|nr:dihydrolipoamide acetyltransferase family protein [Mucilaginibacter sp. PPCGB 2223]OCX53201.1 diapophytoene dehydrogenase [Mucilaginibacter sp. PPCGB 2223]